MDGTDSTRHDAEIVAPVAVQYEPFVVRKYTNEYVRRLLLERHHIRAKLENPGGSVILTASALVDIDRGGVEYSSEIGNSFHLDLIEVEDQLSELSKGDRDTILSYIDGYNDQQAAYYMGVKGGVAIRQRRLRAVTRLVGKLNERSELRGSGNGDTETGREGQGNDPVSPRDIRSTPPIDHQETGDTHEPDRKETQ